MERRKADLVLTNIGELVTLSGSSDIPVTRATEDSLGIIESNELAIGSSGGRISFIGKLSELKEQFDVGSAEEMDCSGHLVIPGFVDAHTHAMFAGSREEELEQKLAGVPYLEILRSGGGILKTVRETRKATKVELENQTRDRLERMMSTGTTTFEIKTGYGLDVENEVKLLETIHDLREIYGFDIETTLLSAHAVPSEYNGRPAEYIQDVVKPTIDIASERNLARFCDVFMEEGAFDISQSREILNYAKSKGLIPKIHADEFSDLHGAHLAAELRMISADHLLKASNDGLAELARAGVISILLPGTSFSSLVGTFANAKEINNQGGAIALATDLSPNSWIESMQFVISLACFGMRMHPAHALVASTINSAHAIGRGKDIGSLELGKFCDLLVLNLRHYNEIPYRVGTNNVLKVVKKGRIIRNNQS